MHQDAKCTCGLDGLAIVEVPVGARKAPRWSRWSLLKEQRIWGSGQLAKDSGER